jgi:hypothetical protein
MQKMMKKTIKFGFIVLCTLLIFSTTGCYVTSRNDNGKHKGWFKNVNNPHNPKSKKNKGKSHRLIQKNNQSFYFHDSNGIARHDEKIGLEMMNK